ncbi:hypothetical protein ACIQYL_20835 [Lysinibacillus xylanilyticus]|uniref:hypothetical protein n=1 Tax=Lysinibacillus xylanilyticus TaxID=582475 RepID=UPI0037F3CEA4
MNHGIRFNKEEILLILARNYTHQSFSSKQAWDSHVMNLKRTILPTSHEIFDELGLSNWDDVIALAKARYNELEKEFNTIDNNKINTYLTNEIAKFTVLKQIRPYREFFSKSTIYYNECVDELYKQENIKLMKAHGLIRIFGTWNAIKKALDIKEAGVGIGEKYNKEYLIDVVKEHGQHFSTPTWEEYAKENELPSLLTIVKHVPKDILLKYTKYTFKYSTDDLIQLAISHRNTFILSIRKWNAYAKENALPTKQTYINQLGTERHNQIVHLLKEEPDITFEELKTVLLAI